MSDEIKREIEERAKRERQLDELRRKHLHAEAGDAKFDSWGRDGDAAYEDWASR